MNQNPEQPTIEGSRPFLLNRCDTAILAGMVLCVASLFLIWTHNPVPESLLHSLPTTLVVNVPAAMPVRGFDLPVRWPLTACAVACGTLLLAAPRAGRPRGAAAQVVCAAVCVLIPVVRFALQPGVTTCLVGGGLLLYGALERWGAAGAAHGERGIPEAP